MAFHTTTLLAALSALAACSAAPLIRDLADMSEHELADAACPVSVKIETYPLHVPSWIKTFKCDWEAIDRRRLEGCVELQDTVLLFKREGGTDRKPISVGCVHVRERYAEAKPPIGD